MKIERKSIQEKGDCAFCNRATFVDDGEGVTVSYPYKYTTVVTSASYGVSINFCDSCIQELINYTGDKDD